MAVSLRDATEADLLAVGALHHRSRAAAYRDILPAAALHATSPEEMGAEWHGRWRRERDTHRLTVAERDGRLIGFSYVGPSEPPDPELGELYAIHVDPTEVARGVGRLLMVDALAALRDHGWRWATLWVLDGNARAQRFYERGGWRPDGRERDGEFGPATARLLGYRRPL